MVLVFLIRKWFSSSENHSSAIALYVVRLLANMIGWMMSFTWLYALMRELEIRSWPGDFWQICRLLMGETSFSYGIGYFHLSHIILMHYWPFGDGSPCICWMFRTTCSILSGTLLLNFFSFYFYRWIFKLSEWAHYSSYGVGLKSGSSASHILVCSSLSNRCHPIINRNACHGNAWY